MRIVGGEWRGRPIEAPEGRDVTRPTTDRVREAASSMIEAARGLSLEDARILDAYAGSGAMGLELLSRGASWCTFVDIDRGACARIGRNARSLGAPISSWRVTRGDVERLAARGQLEGAPFDIVILDPPYANDVSRAALLVSSLASESLLLPHALVLYERNAGSRPLELAGFMSLKQKKYGQTALDLLRQE